MTAKKIRKRIKNRKFLLNILLKFMKPTNKLAVLLSQNLDKDISRYQNHIYKVHIRKSKLSTRFSKLAA